MAERSRDESIDSRNLMDLDERQDSNSNSAQNNGHRRSILDALSIASEYRYDEFKKELKKFTRRRFWWFCWIGLLCIIIMQLSFLPRTSISRDFRRWHGLKLTKTDVKRNYLFYTNMGELSGDYAVEEYINWWLGNLSGIENNSDFNMVADDNERLVSYIESNFKEFGFSVEVASSQVKGLQAPVSSEVKLLDGRGEVVYAAPVFEDDLRTPAYSGFGLDGTEESDYVFINECKPSDFEMVILDGFEINNKIVICKHSQSSALSASEKLQMVQGYKANGFIFYYDHPSFNSSLKGSISKAINRDTVGLDSLVFSKNPLPISIPVLPISRSSVDPILQTLKPSRNTTFKDWDYYPSQREDSSFLLSVKTKFQQSKRRNISNVIGSIEGVLNDAEVIIGASRDSFTFSNPLSNHAILFEIMRNFKRLRSSGWKPLRTIKFISFDGSRNGLLGSKQFVNSTTDGFFSKPILAYINIDSDAVSGDHFQVDSNPLFNHILKQTSGFIPFESSRQIEQNENFMKHPSGQVHFDSSPSFITLLHYWQEQSNGFINNVIGHSLKQSDSFYFENAIGTPTINVKFSNNDEYSSFIPNSNQFSYEWLRKENIDDEFILHGSLIRFIGLLGLSLIEGEVVDFKVSNYANKIQSFSDSLIPRLNSSEWSNRTISNDIISDYSIFADLKGSLTRDKFTFCDMIQAFNSMVGTTLQSALVFDEYMRDIQNEYFKDFAWYKSLKKIRIYAQFKYANYKALRLNSELLLKDTDYKYLNIDANDHFLNHVIYGFPPFDRNESDSYFHTRNVHSIFPNIYCSVLGGDFETTIKHLSVTYEKLKNFKNKIS